MKKLLTFLLAVMTIAAFADPIVQKAQKPLPQKSEAKIEMNAKMGEPYTSKAGMTRDVVDTLMYMAPKGAFFSAFFPYNGILFYSYNVCLVPGHTELTWTNISTGVASNNYGWMYYNPDLTVVEGEKDLICTFPNHPESWDWYHCTPMLFANGYTYDDYQAGNYYSVSERLIMGGSFEDDVLGDGTTLTGMYQFSPRAEYNNVVSTQFGAGFGQDANVFYPNLPDDYKFEGSVDGKIVNFIQIFDYPGKPYSFSRAQFFAYCNAQAGQTLTAKVCRVEEGIINMDDPIAETVYRFPENAFDAQAAIDFYFEKEDPVNGLTEADWLVIDGEIAIVIEGINEIEEIRPILNCISNDVILAHNELESRYSNGYGMWEFYDESGSIIGTSMIPSHMGFKWGDDAFLPLNLLLSINAQFPYIENEETGSVEDIIDRYPMDIVIRASESSDHWKVDEIPDWLNIERTDFFTNGYSGRTILHITVNNNIPDISDVTITYNLHGEEYKLYVFSHITDISLNKDSTSIYVGGSEALTASITPSNAINKKITWTSSNTDVATVDQNGLVTALSLGTATITATTAATTTDGTNLSASCVVNVTGITDISLDKDSISIYAGETDVLTATITPSDVINKTLTWSSSNTDVATVDQNGLMTARSAGTATIKATTTDGTNLSASCQVAVSYEYALVTDSIKHLRGEAATIVECPVELINDQIVSSLQFKVELPGGISLMNNDEGNPDVWLDDTRKARDHSIDVNELGNNSFQFMISSATNKDLKGHDGTLFYMKLLVDQYHDAGIHNINFTNLTLAEADETEHTAVNTSSVVQFSYMLGDADADAQVDVADYITTLLYILNRPTIRFYEDAANVHTANPNINITDLIGITNIAMGIRPTEILHAPALNGIMPAGDMEPEMSISVNKLDGDRWMMSLEMNNDQPIAAMQFDLRLPLGFTLESANLTDRTGKFQLSEGTLEDGALRLMVSAFSADGIEPGVGDVLNLIVHGYPSVDDMIELSNITLAERNLNSHELQPLTVALNTTAIDEISLSSPDVRIYGENGCVVIESPVAGTAQLVRMNGISTPLKVKPGHNVYRVNNNEYYIVNFNGETAKFKF